MQMVLIPKPIVLPESSHPQPREDVLWNWCLMGHLSQKDLSKIALNVSTWIKINLGELCYLLTYCTLPTEAWTPWGPGLSPLYLKVPAYSMNWNAYKEWMRFKIRGSQSTPFLNNDKPFQPRYRPLITALKTPKWYKIPCLLSQHCSL